MDNLEALKSVENLPLSLNLGGKDYQIKTLGHGYIFELFDLINTNRQAENIKLITASLEGKDRLEAIKDIKKQRITIKNLTDIYTEIMGNLSMSDIITIVAFALKIFHKIDLKEAEELIKSNMDTKTVEVLMSASMRVLGIELNDDEEEDKTEKKTVANPT